jgi:hypothetical protein
VKGRFEIEIISKEMGMKKSGRQGSTVISIGTFTCGNWI